MGESIAGVVNRVDRRANRRRGKPRGRASQPRRVDVAGAATCVCARRAAQHGQVLVQKIMMVHALFATPL